MPLNIPKVISNLIVGNDPSQRLFQGVVNAVNPLLGFVNSTFQTLADGTLQIQRNISVQGNSTVTGSQTTGGVSTSGGQVVTGQSRIIGSSVVVGSQVIQKNPDGSAGGQLVQGNLSVLGNLNSATGFKNTYDLGIVWLSNAAASTRYQAKRYAQNNETSNTYNAPTLFQPLYDGSIIGIHGYSQGTGGGNFQIQLYKSNTVVASGTPIYLQTPNFTAGQYYGTGQTYAKGTYPFTGLDYFSASCTFSATGNQFVIITLWVEYGA